MSAISQKRRRERDRPKVHPGSGFNPNKRILLSYDDDDEEPSAVTGPLTPPTASGQLVTNEQLKAGDDKDVDDVDLANYQIDEYPSSDDDDDAREEAHGLEHNPRKIEAGQGGGNDAQWTRGEWRKKANTRNKPKQHGKDHNKAKFERDENTNQAPALGSVGGYPLAEGDEDLNEHVLLEAMTYLDSVRSERLHLPGVLNLNPRNAPHDYLNEGEENDEEKDESLETASAETDPRDAYTQVLKSRFLASRARMQHATSLRAGPMSTAIPQLPREINSNKSRRAWFKIVRNGRPTDAPLQDLDEGSAISLLSLVRDKLLAREALIPENLAAWIWILLARVGDSGILDNDQVHQIRELAKKAILVQLSFHNPAAAQQLEQMSRAEEDDTDDMDSLIDTAAEDPEHLSTTSAPTEDTASASEDKTDTLVTLDAIIVIIGDVFRQRDMLEHRLSWDAQ